MRKKQTHCSKGHELTEDNIYIRVRRGSVERECKICQKARRVYVGNGFKIAVRRNGKFRQVGRSSLQYQQDMRKKALAKLGNKCNSCGFNDLRVLQFHHVNNDGKEERKILKAIGATLFKLVLEDIYNRYELLCSNCHIIKHRNNKESGNIIKAG